MCLGHEDLPLWFERSVCGTFAPMGKLYTFCSKRVAKGPQGIRLWIAKGGTPRLDAYLSLLAFNGSSWGVEKNRFYGRFLTHPDHAGNPNELRATPVHMWSLAVAEFTSREMHLIKRALAIAALAVERVTERSHSDDANLKALAY